jgi:hypothetical protein
MCPYFTDALELGLVALFFFTFGSPEYFNLLHALQGER